MTPDEIIAKLVDLARQIEEAEAFAFSLRQQRLELQAELHRQKWIGPNEKAAP